MQDVYSYIKTEENRYRVMPVPVVEGYEWNMFEHVKLTTLYLNSQYKTGKEDAKPFRNIILPKVNLEHRAVQFDLKEIEFFINDEDEDYKSFLVRKWHERWALQNGISDFLDKLSETYIDYGGVLIKTLKDGLEVVPFQRLAFVDQTDMMSGPICEKHLYSPDQLQDMASAGWQNVEEVIALAQEVKPNSQTQVGITTQLQAITPGRYVEVYELHGMLPETFLDPEGDSNKFVRQMQIVTFYQGKDMTDKKGITLFAGKESNPIYKAFRRDEVYGRALGRGAVEELFEPQVWVNYSEIAKTEMLDQVSKIIYQTADQSFKARNDTTEMKSGDVLTYADGKPLSLLNTQAPNVAAFNEAIKSWDEQAQQIASASPAITGEDTPSGMPFELGQLLNQEAHSLHQYRKERLGIFVTEVYRDWIIPKVQKAVASGDKWMSCLSLDEMGQLVDQVVAYEFNQTLIAKVLKGETVWPDDAQQLEQTYRQQFFKSNRRLITILEGELSDLPLEVEVNITGEQRNKAMMAQKLSNIFTQASNILMQSPNFFTEHPEMAKLFNDIIEASGLSALNFGMTGYLQAPKQGASQQTPTPQLTSQQNAPVPQVQSQS